MTIVSIERPKRFAAENRGLRKSKGKNEWKIDRDVCSDEGIDRHLYECKHSIVCPHCVYLRAL